MSGISVIETDVLIVGAGPAGLSAAIALRRAGYSGRVLVLDKGRSVGDHVLSGAVIDPSGFSALLTSEELGALPVEAHVTRESFRFLLGRRLSFRIPWVPPMMRARGYPMGSLSRIVRHLAKIAKGLDVEIYDSVVVTELVEQGGAVIGARTGAKGLDVEGRPRYGAAPEEEIRAGTTVLAEGAAGILANRLIAQRGLAGWRAQSYALCVKERIRLAEARDVGTILHTFGYPVDSGTYGGGFVYHISPTDVMVGYALGLDYENPDLDVHELFRKFKSSSAVTPHLKGGRVVGYGAKLIPEGGFHAMPIPSVPGVLIAGDSAGLLDGLRIKGVHLAVQSGIAAAQAIVAGKNPDERARLYRAFLTESNAVREVRRVRNVHGGFTHGLVGGVLMSALAWATFGRFPPWRVGHRCRDAETLHLRKGRSVVGPKPSAGPLDSDRTTDVYLSGTRQDEDQPPHVCIRDASVCQICRERYGAPCTRFCPAGVYRVESDGLRVICADCLHCKTCVVKCPYANVEWKFPQAGDGPRYHDL